MEREDGPMHSEEVRKPVWLMAELRGLREMEQDRA